MITPITSKQILCELILSMDLSWVVCCLTKFLSVDALPASSLSVFMPYDIINWHHMVWSRFGLNRLTDRQEICDVTTWCHLGKRTLKMPEATGAWTLRRYTLYTYLSPDLPYFMKCTCTCCLAEVVWSGARSRICIHLCVHKPTSKAHHLHSRNWDNHQFSMSLPNNSLCYLESG